MEDYLSFSYYLHTPKKELPRKIQSRHSVVWDEVEYLESIHAEEIQKYLLLPEVKELHISNNKRNFVNDMLKVISEYIYKKIKRITTFYRDYHRVYNKYKHIFTPQVGTYSVEETVKKPRIFIR
jgi:hypothetical protein